MSVDVTSTTSNTYRLFDFDCSQAGVVHVRDEADDVVHLTLNHPHNRVVAEARVGSEKEEHVGEVGDGDACVGSALEMSTRIWVAEDTHEAL